MVSADNRILYGQLAHSFPSTSSGRAGINIEAITTTPSFDSNTKIVADSGNLKINSRPARPELVEGNEWAIHNFKRLFYLFVLMLFIKSPLCAHNPAQSKPRAYQVRVLLQETERDKSLSYSIAGSNNGFILVNPEAKTKTKIAGSVLTVQFKNNSFLINDHIVLKKRFYICPITSYIKFADKEYQGSLLFTADAQATYVINCLDIEDYVFSVLRTESWPGWPLEVNKALAIACRSYVLGVMSTNKNSTLPYHVKNTNKHQTYSGVHTNTILKDAVDQTRGVFLAYENKAIVAMFDACCGGIIPAHIHGVNFTDAPYLARSYACTYCKGARGYSWQATYPVHEIEKALQKELKQLKKLKEIKVARTDKAGIVQNVQIKSSANKLLTITGKKLYSLFANVRSYCFNIVCADNRVTFSGKGIGHQLGLCQWGAREMVNCGFDYKSILSFYYPKTHFMRLRSL